MFKPIASCLILSGLPTTVAADFFGGPDNYDECITETMKGVTSDVAAKAIIISCRNQFPPSSKSDPSIRSLSPEEVEKITGRAGLMTGNFGEVFPGFFKGRLYNGNEHIAVSEVTISVTTIADGHEETRKYRATISIPPLGTAEFSLQIILGDKSEDVSWRLSAATGRF